MKRLITNWLVLAVLLTFVGCSYLQDYGLLNQPTQETSTSISYSIKANQLETYFPRAGDKAEQALVDLFGSAKISLEVASYSLTAPAIVKALGDAKRRGIATRVITDKVQSAGRSQEVAIDDLLL